MPPFRLNKFRGLPDIPKEMIFGKKVLTTEQKIFNKLLAKEYVSQQELETYKMVLDFYTDVIPQLEKINFSTFTQDDFRNFRGYLNSVIGFELVSGEKVDCSHSVRIVRNNSVLRGTGITGSIPNAKFMREPSVGVVKAIGRYNRASDNKSTLFYGTDTINSALMEAHPQKGELITIGIWKNTYANRHLNLFPISFGEEARAVNESAKKNWQTLLDMTKGYHPYLGDFMKVIFNFLGREYSKKVADVDHLQYYYSAYFTAKVLRNRQIDFDGVIYPSVQNKYKYHNVALKSDVITDKFRLVQAIEILVKDTSYGNILDSFDILDIDYITPEYQKETTSIDINTGDITW